MPTVLVVDDDNAALGALEQFVVWMGHSPVRAADGYGACEAARTHRPALVILDYTMPAGNGVEVAQRLRGSSYGATTPIIILTAKPLREIQAEAAKVPNVRLLQKPVDPQVLKKLVDELLGQPPAPGGPPSPPVPPAPPQL